MEDFDGFDGGLGDDICRDYCNICIVEFKFFIIDYVVFVVFYFVDDFFYEFFVDFCINGFWFFVFVVG